MVVFSAETEERTRIKRNNRTTRKKSLLQNLILNILFILNILLSSSSNLMKKHNFIIQPFQPSDQDATKQLVLAGLEEHWGTLDLTKNPDLNDIQASYAAAVFLVAKIDGQIVGCGALAPRSPARAEIVRMSVAADRRRSGLGRQILTCLVEFARELGFKEVFLETTETWDGVIRFYLDFGFSITHHTDGDVWFKMEL
jgi:putative acetyltransferase